MINRVFPASLQTTAFLGGFSFGYFVVRPVVQEVVIRSFGWEKSLKEKHRNFFVKDFLRRTSRKEKERAIEDFSNRYGTLPLPVLSACSLAGIFASVVMAHVTLSVVWKREVQVVKGIFSAMVSLAGMSTGALVMPWAKRSAISFLEMLKDRGIPSDSSVRSPQGISQTAFVHLCEVASVVSAIFLFHSFFNA